jgi:hypothetical protein
MIVIGAGLGGVLLDYGRNRLGSGEVLPTLFLDLNPVSLKMGYYFAALFHDANSL